VERDGVEYNVDVVCKATTTPAACPEGTVELDGGGATVEREGTSYTVDTLCGTPETEGARDYFPTKIASATGVPISRSAVAARDW